MADWVRDVDDDGDGTEVESGECSIGSVSYITIAKPERRHGERLSGLGDL
jgi:hypothetical protein